MHVYVRVWLRLAPAPPRVVAGYRRRIHQQVGTTVRLECPVSAEPMALVSWFKDDQEINIAWDRYRVVVVAAAVAGVDEASARTLRGREVSQLRVRNATTADSGFYVCTATNGFGTVRVSFQVLVHRTLNIINASYHHHHRHHIAP